MGKRLMWAGMAVGLVAVVLGFVKSGDCGSVFQPRDSSRDTVNALFGSPPPDCTQALDLTVPVLILGVVAGVLLIAGAIGVANRQTAGTHD